MKFTIGGASRVALLAGIAGSLPAAYAQQTPAPAAPVDQIAQNEQTGEVQQRVVVTGSLIAGTPEDAALPVEIYSAEELEEQGSPTALEFVKNLTISGPTTGEAYYFGGADAAKVELHRAGEAGG